ncbi:MAG: amino-acid N-acetyltransferase, partial [Pseudomonadales bacterium]
MHQVPESFINWFRLSAPYIRKHREATFVIALPGEAIEHPNVINLVHDLAMLQSLGAKLVIVQGARIQITRALENSGVDAPIEQGIRVSSDEAMPYIIAASNGTRTELESAMSAGLIDSPMYQLNLKTLSGNFIYAKPLGVRDGVDYQYTGLVRQVDSKAIQAALGTGA